MNLLGDAGQDVIEFGSVILDRIDAMTRQEILDLHFIEARSRLIELAAFLDRVERGTGAADFRWDAILEAVKVLEQPGTDRARQVLISLSDPTIEPVPTASEKGASGAYRPAS